MLWLDQNDPEFTHALGTINRPVLLNPDVVWRAAIKFAYDGRAFMKAVETGVARVKPSRDELWERAERTIKRARDETKLLMDQKYIRAPPA